MQARVFQRPDLCVCRLPVGELDTNCYLLVSGGQAAVVDPGGDPSGIAGAVGTSGADLVFILLTHAHADHTGAAGPLKEEFPESKVLLHEAEADWPGRTSHTLSYWLGSSAPCPEPDLLFSDGFEVNLGERSFRVVHLPGHTPGSSAFYEEGYGVLLCGDVLFAGSAGRVDLPGSSEREMRASLARLKEFPPETIVFPGHGPETTIGREIRENPFLS